MTTGEGGEYCNDCKTWHIGPFEHTMIQAMMMPIKATPDSGEVVGKEATRLAELILAWLYDPEVKYGYTDPKLIQKLVQAIQDEGFRVD